MNYNLLPVEKTVGQTIVQQIMNLVIKNIETGSLNPGDKLPTERELSEKLGFARGTIKSAYKKLEYLNIVNTKQGSGTYVVRDETISLKIQKKKAIDLITKTIYELGDIGLKNSEMRALFNDCLALQTNAVINIAIIYDNPEILLDFKKQLAYIPCISISIYILESVTENQSPERIFNNFDLIIAPTGHYNNILKNLPNFADKLIEAAITPKNETIIAITALPRDCRIGIICRTNVFLKIVKDTLFSFGFKEDCILSFFEMNYTTETYFPGGIDVLISFSQAHIFTNPEFRFRNEEFVAKGGKIIAFHHQIEKGSLIYIEDKIQQLLNKKEF